MGSEVLDGAVILDRKEHEEQMRMPYLYSASTYNIAANTISLVASQSVADHYYNIAYKYELLAEKSEKLARKWEEKEQAYDQIEGATSSLFSYGEKMQAAVSSGLTGIGAAFQNGIYAHDMNASWRYEIIDAYVHKLTADGYGSSKGGRPECTSYTFDPVDLSTGNFIYKKTDLKVGGT